MLDGILSQCDEAQQKSQPQQLKFIVFMISLTDFAAIVKHGWAVSLHFQLI